MRHSNGYGQINSTLKPLKLNEVQPELSSGLSSYRCSFEMSLRFLFNNPNLDNHTFLIGLRNVVAGLLVYERNELAPNDHEIVKIMRAYQNGKRKANRSR